jgi:hypothetical protein
MRTKSLLAVAVLLAAGAASSMAQSVYSLNIVGYVNVTVTNAQLNLLSNPLKPSDGNYNITNTVKLLDGSSGGSTLLQWDKVNTGWIVYDWYDTVGWFPDAPVGLGDGFFVKPTLTQTITFVGEVQTGSSTNTLVPGLNFVGSKVPVAGNEPGGLTGNPGDTIFQWDGTQWVGQDYYAGYGWFDLSGPGTNGPALRVAEGVLYKNTGANVQWIKTLNP